MIDTDFVKHKIDKLQFPIPSGFRYFFIAKFADIWRLNVPDSQERNRDSLKGLTSLQGAVYLLQRVLGYSQGACESEYKTVRYINIVLVQSSVNSTLEYTFSSFVCLSILKFQHAPKKNGIII